MFVIYVQCSYEYIVVPPYESSQEHEYFNRMSNMLPVMSSFCYIDCAELSQFVHLDPCEPIRIICLHSSRMKYVILGIYHTTISTSPCLFSASSCLHCHRGEVLTQLRRVTITVSIPIALQTSLTILTTRCCVKRKTRHFPCFSTGGICCGSMRMHLSACVNVIPVPMRRKVDAIAS